MRKSFPPRTITHASVYTAHIIRDGKGLNIIPYSPCDTVRTESSSSFCSIILPHSAPFVNTFFKKIYFAAFLHIISPPHRNFPLWKWRVRKIEQTVKSATLPRHYAHFSSQNPQKISKSMNFFLFCIVLHEFFDKKSYKMDIYKSELLSYNNQAVRRHQHHSVTHNGHRNLRNIKLMI